MCFKRTGLQVKDVCFFLSYRDIKGVNMRLLPCIVAMERWQEGMGMGEPPRAAVCRRRVNKSPPKAAPPLSHLLLH